MVAIVCMIMMVPLRAAPTVVTIALHDEKQVIHSFGASDAWTCQFVGENWPLEKRNAIADLLFSRDVDSKGNPRGIGLSMWRFNVGAGSAEQGDTSGIWSPWQRAECFLDKDGKYDWNKQKGQQWFMQAAHDRGVPYLLAFTNSPPVQFTLNGIAHSSDKRWTYNIRKDAVPAYADFLVQVAEHFAGKGLPIDYISPANEPQYIWESDKQEGTPAENGEIAEAARLISKGLHDKGLSTKVVVSEAARFDYLWWKEGNPRQNQADAFWNPSSPCYLGSLPNVGRVMLAHSYFTTWPLSKQVDIRQQVPDHLKKVDPKLGFWQSEFCIMGGDRNAIAADKRDPEMDTALFVARLIHNDLTLANASQWSWWLGVSIGNNDDGLVCLGPMPGKDRDSLKTDGQVIPTKIFWALGNYSRFVRPGMVRVGVTYDDGRSPLDASTSLMVSAYLDKKTRQLVIVAVNVTDEAQPLRLSGLSVKGNSFDTYITSKTCDLTRGKSSADAVTIPPRSVVTLVDKTAL